MTFSELIRSVAGSFVPHKAGQQPRQEAQAQPSPAPEALEADVYRPNPEWTRVNVSVQSRHNASILAPKCLEEAKQAAEEAKATQEARKAEIDTAVQKLITNGISVEEILEKLQ